MIVNVYIPMEKMSQMVLFIILEKAKGRNVHQKSDFEYLDYFSSVQVAEWPPFGKELLTSLTIRSLCIMSFCNFSNFAL